MTWQFAFPDSVNTAVYQTPLYAAKGQNSLTNATDSIFQSANPTGLVMAVTSNAATGGYDGAYSIVINATTGVKESEITPEEFSLHQNYPNPFNPTTTIAYNLPASSEVKLTIYDVYGQEVATLVQAKQAAGTHEVPFNASQLSSGFYLYQLRAGSFVATKEMRLIE